ncbi:MAG: glycosyltransferase family 2 protein [Flavobacterium sp.]
MAELVSIITPTFNSIDYLEDTIKSVLCQTYQNWELIIVDDASVDNTVKVVERYILIDSRVKLFILSANEGPGVARQKALDEAKGTFIAFLDSDDVWKPEKLEVQINFLRENNLWFTFSSYECIDESNLIILKSVRAPKTLTYNMLFFGNYVGNLTGIYNAKILGKIPISKIKKRQDWVMWLEILKKVKKTKSIQDSLAYYRVRNNSVSSSKTNLIKYNYLIYRQYHGLSLFLSLLSIITFLFIHFTIKKFYIKSVNKPISSNI